MTTNIKYFYQITDNSLILSWDVLVIILIASIKYLQIIYIELYKNRISMVIYIIFNC